MGLTAAALSGIGSIARAAPGGAFQQKADAISDAIERPHIPKRDFIVSRYGAKADGRTDDSVAIARAINACAQAGGGRIVLPQGTCISGPIRLRSRMELHVPKRARLKFVTDPSRYLPPVHTRWEGVELMGYHPLIYAFDEEDVAVTGTGILDGSADDRTWWPWKGPWAGRYGDTAMAERQNNDRARLFEMAERGVPVTERVFGAGSRLRPPFFQPYRCRRVMMEGVTITAAPFWLLHPVECHDVTFTGVTCSSHGPNNDGIDPESCTGVLIDRCTFDTGDDCIAIKAGRNADGRRIGKPCENIVIRNSLMKDGHAGVAIGSELTGGVRNVFLHDCRMESPALGRILAIKSNGFRGGRIDNIHLRRVNAREVSNAVVQIWMLYEEGAGGAYPPLVTHVSVEDVRVERAARTLIVRGWPEVPVRGLVLRNIVVDQEAKPSVAIDVADVTIDNVMVNGKHWTQDILHALHRDIACDKWATCQ